MKEVLKLTGFILVAIGFLGLIITDFVIDLGITFAVIDAAGLVTLAFAHWGVNQKSTDKV